MMAWECVCLCERPALLLPHGPACAQDLRSATLSLRKSAKKQRIQKEPIKWGAFVVTDFAQRMISDLVPVPLLFEVVYTVLAIPLVLHIGMSCERAGVSQGNGRHV